MTMQAMTHVDPVCGNGKAYYFCAPGCKRKFDEARKSTSSSLIMRSKMEVP